MSNPHLAYTQGPYGQTIADWSAFGKDYAPEQLEIHSDAPDRRFNVDPVEFYFQICNEEKREASPTLHENWQPGNGKIDDHRIEWERKQLRLDAA